MTQQTGDLTDRGAGLEEMGGAGVAKKMKADGALQTSGVFFHDLLQAAESEGSSMVAEPEGLIVGNRQSLFDEPRPRLVEISCERVHRGPGERYGSGPSVLAGFDVQKAVVELQAAECETADFTDPETASVSEFEEGEIAHPKTLFRIR